MKLHLGCGETYLEGYVNIDFPSSAHTVQSMSRADEFHDIKNLSYPLRSLKEIRLHHVFEHFSRPTAAALLTGWWSWLRVGGMLRIEVPDFNRCARSILNPFSSKKTRFVALRHIFGSQESYWAYHLTGWSTMRIRIALDAFGYSVERLKKSAYQQTYNIDVIAIKRATEISKAQFAERAYDWLSLYIVNDTETEQQMLNVWMKEYHGQVEKCWPK